MSQSLYLHQVTRIVFDRCSMSPMGGAVRHFDIHFGNKQKLEITLFSAADGETEGTAQLQVVELKEGEL